MSDIEAIDESEGMSALRKQLKTVSEERDRYRTAVQRQTIREAGLDPELGFVQRLAKDYTGEWTKEAFAEFAKAEGVPLVPAAPVEQAGPVAAPTPVTQLSEADQARLASTSRIDALGAVSAPSEAPSLRQQIDQQEATALGSNTREDWLKSFGLKSQLADQIGEAARKIPT